MKKFGLIGSCLLVFFALGCGRASHRQVTENEPWTMRQTSLPTIQESVPSPAPLPLESQSESESQSQSRSQPQPLQPPNAGAPTPPSMQWDGDTPGKIDNPILAKLFFPVNVAPDMAVNTFIFAFRPLFPRLNNAPESERHTWPLITLLSPVIGPVGGIYDAWHGYPFWNPVARDPEREYYNSRKAQPGLYKY